MQCGFAHITHGKRLADLQFDEFRERGLGGDAAVDEQLNGCDRMSDVVGDLAVRRQCAREKDGCTSYRGTASTDQNECLTRNSAVQVCVSSFRENTQ